MVIRNHSEKAFWRPFTDMGAAGPPIVPVQGDGAWLRATDGRDYLDATAGLWFCQVGFGRREIADAAHAQMVRMHAYHCFGTYSNEPAERLATVLSALAPGGPWKVFLTSGGSDSVDSAVKLVRRYWRERGESQRSVILSRTQSYHGMHVGGTHIGGIDTMRDGDTGSSTDTERIPFDDAEALESAIDRLGARRVAAFTCEPVIGAGGVHFPGSGYLRAVADICRRHGVLFVLDEVITGFGRVGTWFGAERFGIEPDLILCAKGINSGYLPLGAVLVHSRVAEAFWGADPGATFRHGYTYSGHAAAAASALANIDYLRTHDLLAAARRIEARLPDVLRGLDELPVVSEVRLGAAALAAIQLEPALLQRNPALPAQAVRELHAEGVFTRAMSCGALQVSPTLVITDADLELLGTRLGAALERLC